MEHTFNDHDDEEKQVTASPRVLGEQPGGLRSETRMTIQTRQAQKMVLGRKRAKGVQPIVGLLEYGRRMKLLWLSAQADDPYADWYLLRIEESIDEARKIITEKKQWLDEVLNSMSGFEVDIAHSIQPIQVPILFQNPYGYMGAYLISDYDGLCCSVFTASHIGLIDRNTANNLVSVTGKAVRRTFDLPGRWKFTGVTRDDISANNPAAISAISTHGECPVPILKKTKRAKISPEIRIKQKDRQGTLKVKKDKKAGKDEEKKVTATVEQIKPEIREVEPVAVPDKLFGMG